MRLWGGRVDPNDWLVQTVRGFEHSVEGGEQRSAPGDAQGRVLALAHEGAELCQWHCVPAQELAG